MDRADVERILSSAERTLATGEQVDLKRLGFWRAVEAVKHPEWIEAYADRISAIDRDAFRRSTWIDVPSTWVWAASRRGRSSACRSLEVYRTRFPWTPS
jgi:hypothetical protein